MQLRRSLRLFLFGSIGLSVLAGALAVACSDDPGTTPGTDSGTGADRTTPGDDAATTTDSSTDSPSDGGTDAPRDANVRDGNGPGEAGAPCSFNWDCQLALRCECDEINGCGCAPGARGTGRNGVDECDSGNHCYSSVCVEGPGDSGISYCSDECVDNKDCTGKLPLCSTIAFVGRICIRNP
jgi:hypothetical protein